MSRTHAVVHRGSVRPRVLFVGEAPGAEEDRRGLPFVGRSGAILDRAIAALGPGLGEYAIVNVLKCRPPANRFDPDAARTCRPYLDRQIFLMSPELLVPLGARAWSALAPDAGTITANAGRPHPSAYGPLFPLIHPAASLRSRRMAERWRDDLVRLRAWLAAARPETP